MADLLFRVFRMLLIVTGVVGAMAITFPLLEEFSGPPQVHSSPPSAPSTR